MTVYKLVTRPTPIPWIGVSRRSPLVPWLVAAGCIRRLSVYEIHATNASQPRSVSHIDFYPCVLAGRSVVYCDGPQIWWTYAPCDLRDWRKYQ